MAPLISSAYIFNSNTQKNFSHLFASMLILLIFISKSNKTYSLFLLYACTCYKFIITTLTSPYQRVENRNDLKSSQFRIFVSSLCQEKGNVKAWYQRSVIFILKQWGTLDGVGFGCRMESRGVEQVEELVLGSNQVKDNSVLD